MKNKISPPCIQHLKGGFELFLGVFITKIVRRFDNTISIYTLLIMLSIVFITLLEAGFDNNVVNWLLLALLPAILCLALKSRIIISISFSNPLFWYLLFLLFSGLSIVWSINPHRTLVEFLQLSLYLLILIITAILSEDDMVRVGRITLIVGFGIALLGISQYLFFSSSRIISTFPNPNPLAIFLVMLFLLGWGVYLHVPHSYLAIACTVFLVAVFLTQSRGALICLVVAIPFLLITLNRECIKKALIKTASIIALALIITQLAILVAPYLQESVGSKVTILEHIIRSSFISWSGVSRFALWETGVKVALSQPASGTGLGTFYLAYFTEYIDNMWYSRYVHNHYIQVFAELGLLGFTLFIIFIGTLIRIMWIIYRRNNYPVFYPGVIAAVIAFMINIGGDFSWNFPGVTVIFFLCTGVLINIGFETVNHSACKIHKGIIIFSACILVIITAWQLTANLLYEKGVTFENSGEYESALIAYERANLIYPINPNAYDHIGKLYYGLAISNDDYTLTEIALENAEIAVKISPYDGDLHNWLGLLLWQMGKLDEAEKHLKQAVDYAGYRLGMYVNLAWFYIEQGRYEEAEIVVNKGLKLEKYATGMHPTEEYKEEAIIKIDLLYKFLDIIETRRGTGNPVY